ncbi:MAG: hypothetical protein WAM60_23625 [Candidatus Promineifilaceae bacterium]
MSNYLWRSRLFNKWTLLLSAVLVAFCFVCFNPVAAAGSVNPESTLFSASSVGSPAMRDCTNTSTGLVPLMDLVNGEYQGFAGGLYEGSNEAPTQHMQIGMEAGQNVQPLDIEGQPEEMGKIVFLAVGMSNTKQEFQQFLKVARNRKDRRVALLNGAQGGFDAPRIADPDSQYWTKIDSQLDRRGLSPLQVQVVWFKDAIANETAPFPQDAQNLQGYIRDIVLIIESRYPNVKTIYFSSRAYGGYGGNASPSPETWAYQGGFAVKWLIESQINGTDPDMAYDNTPWLAWGPYTWADGMTPRSDGLIWQCNDFEDDGVHPAPSGEMKVANMLLSFFSENPTTTDWFTNNRGAGISELFGQNFGLKG